jgi:hypothetical protein
MQRLKCRRNFAFTNKECELLQTFQLIQKPPKRRDLLRELGEQSLMDKYKTREGAVLVNVGSAIRKRKGAKHLTIGEVALKFLKARDRRAEVSYY